LNTGRFGTSTNISWILIAVLAVGYWVAFGIDTFGFGGLSFCF
jgi:hypothetical protein